MNAVEHREIFLRALFEGLPGLIELRSFDGEGVARRTFNSTIKEALGAVDRDVRDGMNVYVGVATRGESRGENGKLSGGKDNLIAVRGWFVDKDGLLTAEAREQYEGMLKGFPLPPGIRVDSGGGEHPYWLTEDPLLLDTPERIAAFEHTLKGLADALGGDKAATDASRIMRVPGTFNIPTAEKLARGRAKSKCRLISHGGPTCTPEDVEIFRIRGEALRPSPTTAKTNTDDASFKPGQRHEALVRHAAFLRKSGLSQEAAQAALLVFNRERCDPPKPEDEVRSLIEWAERVEPGENNAQEVEAGESARLDELAQLSQIEYDRCRQAVADELGIRVSTLDAEVSKRRPSANGDAGDGGGTPALFAEPEPWPDPVDGPELLKELAEAYSRFLVLPEGAPTALALWTLHTHAHDAASISPILGITSPVMRCGKSTVLSVLHHLVRRPLSTSNITAPALFRTTERWAPTLLIDEGDSFLKGSDDLRGILNSGHSRRLAAVIRTTGDDHEPRVFKTWSPKAIALIGSLAPTLEDRSIVISMRRSGPGEKVEELRADQDNGLGELRRRCIRWTSDHLERLRMADPRAPADLHARAKDNWRPLLSIADEAGGNWPKVARKVAVGLLSSEDETSLGILLLGDVREVFGQAENLDRMASEELCRALVALPDRPWSEIGRGGKLLTTNGLARRLKSFGVKPKKIRFGDDTANGYLLEHFQDSFARYLPQPEVSGIPSGTPEQRNGNGGLQPNPTGTRGENVPVGDPENLNEIKGCPGVPVGQPDRPEEGTHQPDLEVIT